MLRRYAVITRVVATIARTIKINAGLFGSGFVAMSSLLVLGAISMSRG
jgi:hypothetical protein